MFEMKAKVLCYNPENEDTKLIIKDSMHDGRVKIFHDGRFNEYCTDDLIEAIRRCTK